MSGKSWEEIGAAKRKEVLDSIPEEWRIPPKVFPPETQLDVTAFPAESGLFTREELEITAAHAADILENVRTSKWTAVQVAQSFCKRAAVAHQLTNCLTTFFPSQALSRAAELDEYLKQNGKPIGPLHGLAISLKDNFNIVGYASSVGFAYWANEPATYNSTLVDLLHNAGAILYCKTSVPTAMMIPETVNNVFGRTLNPLNRALTSGGSSGGESALIAFGGSVLGVGTDIGGSLRIPAACTGIYTIRPSFGRFPTARARSGLAGQEAVNSVNGPMARTLNDVVFFSKTVVEAKPWLQDPKCIPIPWREVELKGPLKLGVLWDDGIVTPTPPVKRALKETVEKLRRKGCEIIDWKPDGHKQALSILGRMFLADGGKSIRAILDPVNEPIRPEMEPYSKAKELGTYDMWQLQLERTELCKQYLDRWNACDGLDGILCPTTPYASVEHGKFRHVGYTGVFNVLDYSAVSFPSGTKADKDLDMLDPTFSALSDTDAEVQSDYNPKTVHGMPVSLQIVARRLEEEKVLKMTETVLGLLR